MATPGNNRSRTCGWSVFDGVKAFPPTPESLMAEIDAAIAASEHAHATSLLSSSSSSSSITTTYDARIADESYKAACAALSAGKPEAALRSLRVALASCPPDKPSALSKLQSLMSFASSQQQKQHHSQH